MLLNAQARPEAYIAIGRNRQKIYSGNQIYLPGGTEFSIELFNPTTQTVAAKIYLNNQPISNSLIVIRPGRREYLERYIDDSRKFLFDVYEVENSKEAKAATADNGKVRVEFFKAQQVQQPWPGGTTSPTWVYYGTGNPIYNPSTTIGLSNCSFTANASNSMYTNTSLNVSGSLNEVHDGQACMDSVETGRVEAGDRSNQNFDSYYGNFETWHSWSTDYTIQPISAKPVEIAKIRQYCPECRTRIRKQSWKFCPSCGESL